MRCRMPSCRAEEPGGFAVTAGVAGQGAEALQDVGNAQVRLDVGGASRARRGRRVRPVPAHPARSPTRARVVSASIRYQPVVVVTASSAQRRAATRSPPASAACAPISALHRRRRGQDTQMLPGRLARVLRRRGIAGGQGRGSQRRVGDARGHPAKLGGGLDGRVGRGPGRTRVTLPRQCDALAREAVRLIRIPS